MTGMTRKRGSHGHAKAAGKAASPTYTSWQCMIGRCLRPSAPRVCDYGGRGITVCERWRSFENFLSDMGERPNGASIDRVDPDGNYEPGNCRWATSIEQRRNRRSTVLSPAAAMLMRHMAMRGSKQRDIAWAFGVHFTHVSHVVRRKIWVGELLDEQPQSNGVKSRVAQARQEAETQ